MVMLQICSGLQILSEKSKESTHLWCVLCYAPSAVSFETLPRNDKETSTKDDQCNEKLCVNPQTMCFALDEGLSANQKALLHWALELPSVCCALAKASTDDTKMPSQIEHAMETMMFTCHKFAGDKGYLTKEDLRVLMEKEFPGVLENQKDPLAVDKIMKDLDQCRDGKVDFQSCFSLTAGLTIACNDCFVVHMKQKGKK
ncbi:hypothetical protein P7K49_004493 [Saguinus oedipus]|uniref:Protein S100-A10 n=1 Tax=Saguinus oedipus TaxID=9490 RepID=A0ABQ9WB44_SAGOE|nr:hypothetical protein P7K49_004493 [Saguinus oedipus]